MERGPKALGAAARRRQVISDGAVRALSPLRARAGARAASSTTSRGACWCPRMLIWFRLQRSGREHAQLRGRPDRRLQPPQLPRPVRDRGPASVAAPDAVRRQGRAVREALASGWLLSRLGAFPIRRGQSDETAMETARLIVERGGTVIIFPEGTRHPHRLARAAQARRRPAGARDGRRRAPGRRPGLRAGAPRLAHQAAQGQAARRDPAHLPAHRAPVAGARGDRHRAHLAQHRAAVGVARRPAAAAQGGGRSAPAAGAPRSPCCSPAAGSRSSSVAAATRRRG